MQNDRNSEDVARGNRRRPNVAQCSAGLRERKASKNRQENESESQQDTNAGNSRVAKSEAIPIHHFGHK